MMEMMNNCSVFKYLAFILEFSQELLKLKFTIYGKHEPKTKV